MSPGFIAILFALGLALIIVTYYRQSQRRSAQMAEEQIEEILDIDSLGQVPDAPISAAKQGAEVSPGRKIINSLADALSGMKMIRTDEGRDFLTDLDQRLVLAGRRDQYTPEQALALALAIWGLGVALPIFLVFVFPLPKILVIIIVIFFLFYPFLRLRRDIRNRQDQIEVEIPFFINEVYMSLSAGATIDQAIIRAADSDQRDGYQSILAREFAQAQIEYSMGGRDQITALRDIYQRTGVDSVSGLVEALIQGIRTGADLSLTLQNYSDQAQELWAQAMRDFKNRKDPAITIGVVITMSGGFLIYAAPLLAGMVEALGNL
jgi:tight adherence protein C